MRFEAVLEKAVVLREIVASGGGMMQVEIGQLSRVSGQIRAGTLPPGAARHPLVLPAGNQNELASMVTHENRQPGH